jgi:hypothetical protein
MRMDSRDKVNNVEWGGLNFGTSRWMFNSPDVDH